MNRLAWALQSILGVFFVAIGILHFLVPPSLPEPLIWMYDLPTWLHYVSGPAEILGGLGLILPGLTGIRPELTPLAAGGLVLIMLGAVIWHAGRGEVRNLVTNLVVAGLLALVAVVRWRRSQSPARA